MFLEQNKNFPRRRLVRSRNVFLTSAQLDFLVVNKKTVLRTCWDLSTWDKTCFLFKLQSHVLAALFSPNATFGTLTLSSCVWDVLRYRILKRELLIFSETCSPSFCILCKCFDDFRTNLPKVMGDLTERKTRTFQTDVECVPNLSVWALLRFFLWL